MAITQSLSQACAGYADCVVATCGPLDAIFHRHATADELRSYVKDWDGIFKFAVDRPAAEIVASMERLRRHDLLIGVHLRPECNEHYRQWLIDDTPIELDDPWSHWCNDPSVVRIPYAELRSRWNWICERCNIPYRRLARLNARPA